MTAEANDLALHLVKQCQTRPELAYLIGPYTRTWELLVAPIASITGESCEEAEVRMKSGMGQ